MGKAPRRCGVKWPLHGNHTTQCCTGALQRPDSQVPWLLPEQPHSGLALLRSPCLFLAFYYSFLLPEKQTSEPQDHLGPVMVLLLCSEQGGGCCQQDSDLPALLLLQYRTVLVPVVKSPGFPKIPGKSLSFIYFAPDDENPEIQRPVFLELTPSPEMTYRTLPGTSNEMNVLGIVIFSATIGTCSRHNRA